MIEREVKIEFTEKEDPLELLRGLNPLEESDWAFEDNWVVDYPDGRLKERGLLFRLRKSGERWFLTFKKPPAGAPDPRFKTLEEWQTEMGEGEGFLGVLAELGLLPVFRYQKFRKDFHFLGGIASLDRTPFALFIELEGSEEFIFRFTRGLGKSPEDFLTSNYHTLFRERGGEGDMVFPSR